MKRTLCIAAAACAIAIVACALVYSPAAPPRLNHHAAITDPADSLSWEQLASAREFHFNRTMDYVPRHYPDAVRKRADTEIELKGYMIATRPERTFSQFLLVPFPPSCPFCAPAGPSETIQVQTQERVKFAFRPVLVRGLLKLYEHDDSPLFYQLQDAEIIGQ